MPPTAGKKKPSGKIVIRESPESTPIQATDLTSETPGPALPQSPANNGDLRSQLNQTASITLGAPTQLTDEQFRILLERLTPVDPNLSMRGVPIGSVQRDGPNDPDDSPSDSASYQDRRPSHHGRHRRHWTRSPKHDDPEKLDDGVSPSYASWCILLEGKLEANADWWPTEQGRINYAFSRTTGKAQSHLEPRMSRTSTTRWTSVEEILDYLDTVLRNHFEKEESQDQYTRLVQGPAEDFNDFHSEFARLASLGEVSPTVWRADLYRKLNRTLQDRLIATEHQYSSYSLLVRECQRINVRLLEYRRRFPKSEPPQRPRPSSTTAPKATGIVWVPSSGTPAHGFRRSPGVLQGPPPLNKRDSKTPGPRPSPGPETDPTSKGPCFSCGEVGHFASSCLNPRTTPKINEIGQEEASGEEASDEADSDREN
jgi:hypothetical protein